MSYTAILTDRVAMNFDVANADVFDRKTIESCSLCGEIDS